MSPRPCLLIAAIILLAPAGCGPAKLDETRNYDLEPGDVKSIILPAQPKPQRLTVSFDSNEPVDVAVYKSDDAAELFSLPTSKALAIERAKTSGTLTADLGPDVATTVTVSALSKKATVKVHVTNRK
ncbi:hypothetical protein J0H58_27185 [bacterium]|nr:hypothetical protein [bacterium]